jgi:hypothetical protein
LGHQQHGATGVTHGAIHLAGLVGEDAVGDEARRQLGGRVQAVVALYSRQYEQSNANFPDYFLIYSYSRPTYSLNKANHLKYPRNSQVKLFQWLSMSVNFM